MSQTGHNPHDYNPVNYQMALPLGTISLPMVTGQ